MNAVEQVEDKLRQSIDPARIRRRDGPSGKQLEYLNDGDVALGLNEAFGPCGWDAHLVDVNLVKAGRVDALGVFVDDPSVLTTAWDAVATARVRVVGRAVDATGRVISTERTDVGASSGPRGRGNTPNAKSLAEAVEFAVKSATTDAFKRACRLFGPKTGLLLRFDAKDRETVQGVIDAMAQADDMVAEAAMAEVTGEDAPAPIEVEGEIVSSTVVEEPVQEEVAEAATPEVAAEATSEVAADAETTESQVVEGEVAETPADVAAESTPVEETPAEVVEEVPAEEAPAAEAETTEEAPVGEAEPTASASGPVEPPQVLVELPGCAEAIARIAALENPTDAIELQDAVSIHKGLVATFNKEAANKFWELVGVDLTSKPILVSRDQVMAIAQVLEEANAQEGGVAAFIAILTDPEQTPIENADAATAGTNDTTVETHGEQVQQAWDEWMTRLGKGVTAEPIHAELTTKGDSEPVSVEIRSAIHSFGITRMRTRNMAVMDVCKLWKKVGVDFGRGNPTVEQAKHFLCLLPGD